MNLTAPAQPSEAASASSSARGSPSPTTASRTGAPSWRARANGAQQDVDALDRREAADEGRQHLVGTDAELVAERAARFGREREEAVELEAERDHLELRAVGDAEAHEVVDDRAADADEPIGPKGEATLEQAVEALDRRAEVALEDVAVVRVDDDGPGAHDLGGEPPDHPRLRRVGVNEVRL